MRPLNLSILSTRLVCGIEEGVGAFAMDRFDAADRDPALGIRL
jgi:hypothetical protein